jgi:hypothetical protein
VQQLLLWFVVPRRWGRNVGIIGEPTHERTGDGISNADPAIAINHNVGLKGRSGAGVSKGPIIHAQDIYCRGEHSFCECSLIRQRCPSTDAIWWSWWRRHYNHECVHSYNKEQARDRCSCGCLVMEQRIYGTGLAKWASVGSQTPVQEDVVRRQMGHDSPETIADQHRSIDKV